jgi:Ca2+-binding RTX toxin-like protein
MASLSKLGAIFPEDPVGLYIEGTELNDFISGTDYADEIHGRGGSDVLSGHGGDDRIFGESGNDSLFGDNGNDLLDGGIGNDLLVGGAGADQLIGGTGVDTVSYASSASGVYVDLANNLGLFGDAQGDTFSGVEKVIGTRGDDWLIADDRGITFDGGDGSDYLKGGAGWDTLNGGFGIDTLEGGLGLDLLTGGANSDLFKFNWGDGPDIVTDFQPGVDKIVLGNGFAFHGGVFGTDGELATGTEVPTFLPPHHNIDHLFYDTDDHVLYELSVSALAPFGEPNVMATPLALFSNGIQLHTSDFLL